MKSLILLLSIVFFNYGAIASEAAKTAPAAAFRKVAQEGGNACRTKVEKLIHSTAQAMGLKTAFGLQMTSASSGTDMYDAPLTTYTSGVFIVNDGYVSNSGATIVVRANSCEVIKMTITVGG